MKSISFWMASILTALASTAMGGGGGMDSGGGKFSTTATNPWFLQNTTTVRYCVDINTSVFGLDKRSAEVQVRKALDYWTDQLKDVGAPEWSKNDPVIGTQNFVSEECGTDTDLRFQLGKLTKSQALVIERPQDFVALAYRTSYNKVNMKGRGFIYVSPESGPMKMKSFDVIENTWSRDGGIRLYGVLIHELGHIYGIQHGKIPKLMDENHAETIVSKLAANYTPERIANFFSSKRRLFRYDQKTFSPTGDWMYTRDYRPSMGLEKFFGIENADLKGRTVSFRMPVGNKLEIFDYPLNYGSGTQNVLGTAMIKFEEHALRVSHSLFSVFLPEGQKALEQNASYPVQQYGTYVTGLQLKADYVSADGSTRRPITIISAFPFGNMQVGGLMDDRYYFNIFNGY